MANCIRELNKPEASLGNCLFWTKDISRKYSVSILEAALYRPLFAKIGK